MGFNMNIDLSSIETEVLQALGIVLFSLLSLAAQKFVAWLKLKNGAQVQAAIDGAADKAINFGVMKAQEKIRAEGWDSVSVQNQVAATAVSYVADKFPEALKSAGIDPTTPDGAQKIEDIVTRSLPASMAAAAASPTTPQAPGTTTTVLQSTVATGDAK